ncbi:MAG: insulinase family protein, partial [Treponema sp.]|nr:insulinase family protein [Treponema sp.]
MMTQGSASYSYDELMHIFYETNCSLSPSSSRESSSLTLSCIDYYFEKLFPLFADSFLHPAFNDEQFNNLLTSYKQNLQRLQTDPQSLLSYEMTNAIFQNHPYATSSAVKPYSIQNITLENIKKLHEEILDSRRIFIVAVGNFNKSKLLKNLDTAIGKIPALTSELKTQNIFPLDVKPGNTVITNEAAAGTGFLEKVMRGPSVYDDDMIAASIASSMYSSVLFNVVREKYGACYTPSASVTAMKAGLASVHIFRASDLQNIIKYENEAHKIFESGFVIDGKNEDGSYIFSPIAERLEGYKNQYINSFYGSSLSPTNIASRMVYSIVMFNSPYSYDEKIMSVQNVSALDVKNAFEKYFCKNGAWFAVVGKADKSSIKFTSD